MRMIADEGCSVLAVFNTSRPVLPPIFRSLTTTSKKPSWSFSMAALPLGASSTSWPASDTACARPRRRESWSSAIRIRPMQLFLVAASYRQRDPNRGALTWDRPQVYPSVMRVHDLPDDGQAKPGALGLRREERVEHFFRHVGQNPRSVIGKFDEHCVTPVAGILDPQHLGGDRHPPLATHRLVGVHQQVGEHLCDLMLVGVDVRQAVSDRDV